MKKNKRKNNTPKKLKKIKKYLEKLQEELKKCYYKPINTIAPLTIIT